MTERALSFGSVAAAYERYRPGYPDELVGRVLAYTTGRTRTALEIGAGTGKATRAFISHGVEVLATEPDAEMLAELRREVPGANTRQATLEQLKSPASYDLVYVAAALHWTDPATRWERIASQLRPAGTFASFGGPMNLVNAADREALDSVRSSELAEDVAPPPGGEMCWPDTELVDSSIFRDVRQEVVERRWTMPAVDYVGNLSTVSAYLLLPEHERAEALRRITAALPERVAVSADVTLHLARRV